MDHKIKIIVDSEWRTRLKLRDVFHEVTDDDLDQIEKILDDYRDFCRKAKNLDMSVDDLLDPDEIVEVTPYMKSSMINHRRSKAVDDIFDIFQKYLEFKEE